MASVFNNGEKNAAAAEKYADIINLTHHTSPRRHRMSMYDRAAQFSPFAALTGYEAQVREVERVTEERAELSEDVLNGLDERLQLLMARLAERPTVSVTYFVPDVKKAGGEYVLHSGVVRRVDTFGRRLLFEDGTLVEIAAVRAIEGEIFAE